MHGELKVEELISYGRYPHRNNVNKLTTKDKEMIDWALNITKTSEFRTRQIANLSGGQRQKVWLAMALAQETEVLLLDEPTTYLDMSHQLDVLQIVEKLNKEHNCTVVMVLHDINHAARFSDEIIAMKEGEIVTTGSPEEIITNEVLKEVFHIDARVMIDPYNGAPVCFGYDSVVSQEEKIEIYVTKKGDRVNTTVEKQQIIISNTEQWKMYSKLEGKEYQIHISKPRQPAPDSGYPVIYVLDGNAFFKHFMKQLKYNQ